MEKEAGHLKSDIVVLNCIYCVMIVFIHCSSDAISVRQGLLFTLLLPFWRISFFAVSGFVFLSGYKSFLVTKSTPYVPYIVRRFRKIFLPYVLWNVIFYVNFVAWGYFPFSASELVWYIFHGTLSAPFYFVIVIMQFYLLMPLWRYMIDKMKPGALLGTGILMQFVGKTFLQPLYLELFPQDTSNFFGKLFFHYGMVWTLGMCFGRYGEDILPKLQSRAALLWAGAAIFGGFSVWASYEKYVNDVELFGAATVYQIYIFFAVLVTTLVAQKIRVNAAFLTLNAITFPVFLNHCFVLLYVSRIVSRLALPNYIGFVLQLGLVFAITFIGNYLWVYGRKRFLQKKTQ